MSTPAAIGVDLGGTKCLAVGVSEEGEPLARHAVPTPVTSDEILRAVAHVARQAGHETGIPVGVGMPGLVTDGGTFVVGPNLPRMVDVNVASALATELRSEVVVDNDATAAAWGEFQLGSARGHRSAVMLTLGTGIGGGLIMGGALVRGQHGFTAEPGHMVVHRGGLLCACGRKGCIEAYASGTGLETLAKTAARAGALAGVLDAAGSVDAIKGEHVSQAALGGDAEALAVFDELGGWLGVAIADLVNLLVPDIVVIGGGLSAVFDLFAPAARRSLAEGAVSRFHREVPVVRAALVADAGAIGAALLARDDG